MKFLSKYNPALLLLPILIFSLGYVTLLSTSPERARNQLLYFVAGLVLYIFFSQIDYRLYKYYWKYIYLTAFVFLLLTFVFGEVRYGSIRWIDLGFVTIQPSEFAKIVVILTIASLITMKEGSLKSLKYLLKMAALIIPLIVLVFVQPDLGTSLVMAVSLIFIFFYAGLNKWIFISGFLIVGIFSNPIWNTLKDYQKERILVFLNPALDVLGSGYNVIQSVIAVGSGGLWGKGFGHGTQSQLNFLPAYWTDFIFASFSEEWGFVGVFILLFLFTFLVLSLLYVSHKTADPFGMLVVTGVFSVFFFQFVINVGMNLGVLPVTGIPLPLVSYGGSSLFTSMILLGIVQSVWINRQTR
jgi:rod shape determining protein RodA